MSFILDALKKSELERQRQSVPGLIEVPVAARRRGVPAWVWILVALLCVNVAVLLVLLLRGGMAGTAQHSTGGSVPAQQPARTAPAAAPPAGNPAAAASAPDHFSPLDNQPVYAPEIPVQDDAAEVQSTPARSVPPAHAARRADLGRADAGGPVLNDEPSEDQEMLPTISELNLTGSQSLPEIHLDVHVYATRTADRFVYINMRKYREGAVLQEGPTLERIRRDGVVLNYNGLRFLVPRQ